LAFKFEFLFENRNEQINGNGDPDLGFDGVVGIAKKRLNMQVLLYPPKKQFDLPPLFIKLGNA
jgi:hypothetical protein